MDIEEIKAILDAIENEAGDIYNQADNGCDDTGDCDPVVSEVESIISLSYSHFDIIRDWSGTITNLVEDVRFQLEQDTEDQLTSVCSRCGNRG